MVRKFVQSMEGLKTVKCSRTVSVAAVSSGLINPLVASFLLER